MLWNKLSIHLGSEPYYTLALNYIFHLTEITKTYHHRLKSASQEILLKDVNAFDIRRVKLDRFASRDLLNILMGFMEFRIKINLAKAKDTKVTQDSIAAEITHLLQQHESCQNEMKHELGIFIVEYYLIALHELISANKGCQVLFTLKDRVLALCAEHQAAELYHVCYQHSSTHVAKFNVDAGIETFNQLTLILKKHKYDLESVGVGFHFDKHIISVIGMIAIAIKLAGKQHRNMTQNTQGMQNSIKSICASTDSK